MSNIDKFTSGASKEYKILWYSVLIYGLVVLLDPTNSILHLKIPAFAICLITCFFAAFDKTRANVVKAIAICWLFLSYGILISLLSTDRIDTSYRNQICNLYFLTLLILPISRLSLGQILKLSFIIGIILGVSIIILYIMYEYLGYGQILYTYFCETANNTVLISNRQTLGIKTIMFFYKSMPFLLIPIAYTLCYLKGTKLIISLIILLIPIILGGSRTPILCAIALIGIVCLLKTNSKNIKIVLFLGLSISIIILLCNLISEAKIEKELKFDSYNAYVESITSEPVNLLFGKGVGGLLLIPTRGYRAYSELSFLDLINQYGVIIGIMFGLFLLSPGLLLIKRNNINYKIFGYSYLLYMVVAATNPLLFSSTGWFVWSIMYAIANKYKN